MSVYVERIARSRRTKVVLLFIGAMGFLVLAILAGIRLEIYPQRLLNGTAKFFSLVVRFFPPRDGGGLLSYGFAIAETLSMAFWGTLIAAALAIPLSFAAASNFSSIPWLRFLLRRSFDLVRGVDSLVWALVFVHVVGLGPFAGILAIAIMDTAVLGKLFAEAIENADMSEVEGVRSAGAGMLGVLRYGFIPQLAPIFFSNVLYFFEGNVRSASILGVLGAGGIGMQLMDRIRIMNWPEVGFILLILLACIAIIDALSKKIRTHITGNPGKE